ncbi:MAG: hypothetical protein GY757_08950, partial [bacterium]|nr:hypothetical protein [bacterium]
MTNNERIIRKRVAVITNNIHCERHYQYSSTIEKYFATNDWEIAEGFDVNKIVICACGFHDAMYDKIKRTLAEISKTNFLDKNIIVMACLTKTHENELKKNFKGEIVDIYHEEQLDKIIEAQVPFAEISPVNIFHVPEKCDVDTEKDDRFFVKISEGCLKECTFCVINKAKGQLRSFSFETITKQVQKAVTLGRKKVFLMGEDTFAYGIDSGTDII